MSYSEDYLKGWSDAYTQWQRTNKVPNRPPAPVEKPEPLKAPPKKVGSKAKTGDE